MNAATATANNSANVSRGNNMPATIVPTFDAGKAIDNIMKLVKARKTARKTAETNGKEFTDELKRKEGGKMVTTTYKTAIESQVKAAISEGLTFGDLLPNNATMYGFGTFDNGQRSGVQISTSGKIQTFGTFADSFAIVGNNEATVNPVRSLSLFAYFLTYEANLDAAIRGAAYLTTFKAESTGKEVTALKRLVATIIAKPVTDVITAKLANVTDENRAQLREQAHTDINRETQRAAMLRSGISQLRKSVNELTAEPKAVKEPRKGKTARA